MLAAMAELRPAPRPWKQPPRSESGHRRGCVRTYRVAVIAGDGIGKEVIAAGIEVLEACTRRDGGFVLQFDQFDWGSERYQKTGAFMPADGLAQIKGLAAILFGGAMCA